jgi:hypothetical protein
MASKLDITSTSTIFNNNTINPRDLTMFNAFRGVTDFTNINQFSQYESGYQALFVLQMPWFMEQLEPTLTESFRHMLEYEFRGLDGLPDITADTMEITDGINTQRLINKVTYDTSATVSSSYFEKTGSLITRWSELYLTGIKDKNSQAKTYHGLIKNGKCMDPGPDKEIFTMLYVVTDATMYRLERAVLLANCQLTKAETSMYNGNRSDINNKEMSIEWTCFPIMNNAVDAAARKVLEKVNGIKINYVKDKNDGGLIGSTALNVTQGDRNASGGNGKIVYSELDSTEYEYGVASTPSFSSGNAAGGGKSAGGMVNPTDLGQYFNGSKTK